MADATTASVSAAEPVRVMVVDDSAVIRGFVSRWLEAEPDVAVVSTVGDGDLALKSIERSAAEVVILDIEMPQLDGLSALPELLKIDPGLKVIMASNLTRRNADVSLRALSMGAADYIAKPTSLADSSGADEYRRQLIEKVIALGHTRRHRNGLGAAAVTARVVPRPSVAPPTSATRPPEALAIGASTGGPQALLDVFGQLKNSLSAPIFLTQHMPPTFTTLLAEHIGRVSGAP